MEGWTIDCGWIWLCAGAAMMLLEMAAPGFVLFFFGLAAATTGVLRLVAGDAFAATWQLAAFSAFSILYLAFLRRFFRDLFAGDAETAQSVAAGDCVGRFAKTVTPLAPNAPGRVMLGDSEWTALSSVPLAAGADVKVVAQENLTLRVEPL